MTDIPSSLADLDSNDPLPGEPWTELGYARRLIRVYGGRLRYVPAWNRWLMWDGKRWAHDSTGQAQRWMKVIARRLTTDALALEDDAKRRATMNLRPPGRVVSWGQGCTHPRRDRDGDRSDPGRPGR
jgi:hypothetical protein